MPTLPLMLPNTKLTTARLYWLPLGAVDGYIDFGNIPDYKDAPKRQRVEHMASRRGKKVTDLSLVKSNEQLKTFTLDEDFNTTLLLLALANQNANTIQPNVVDADSTFATTDDTVITVDGTGAVLTAVFANPASTRVYDLARQGVTLLTAKDGNNANLVFGVDYNLDAGAGMVTVLQAAPATPWTFTYTCLQVTDLNFTGFDTLLTTGKFVFFEFDQFDAVPFATERFSGQCYITAWGDADGDKFTEFTLEVLITP
jgi:hypothetical protein